MEGKDEVERNKEKSGVGCIERCGDSALSLHQRVIIAIGEVYMIGQRGERKKKVCD